MSSINKVTAQKLYLCTCTIYNWILPKSEYKNMILLDYLTGEESDANNLQIKKETGRYIARTPLMEPSLT